MSSSTPPPSETASPALVSHRARLELARRELRRLDGVSARYSNARAVAFLVAVGAAALWYFGKLTSGAPEWIGAGAIAYAALAFRHQRVFRLEERTRIQVRLSERGISRLTGNWHSFPEKGERFIDPNHLYSSDLDLFGQGSLFQLMDQTATHAGEDRLAAYLLAPADLDTVRERQSAIRELAPLVDFREALNIEGQLISTDKPNPSGFIRWAEGGPYLAAVRWARPLAWALPLLTLALVAGREFQLLPPAAWWGGLAALLGTSALTRRRLTDFYNSVAASEGGFARYEKLFAVVEAQTFQSPMLRRIAGAASERRASAALTGFSRLWAFVELRQSPQLHALIHLLTLWDVHWMFQVEKWRRTTHHQVRGWFEALAELEALCSLAGMVHERPEFAFPELLPAGPSFSARGLRHPLLENAVPNDVDLRDGHQALLITGSNMSGKTTLVRAIGVNAVLALAGAPVSASELRISSLQTLTSMRVKDSLERGVSYFYAEVQRLKAVLDGAHAAQGQALFLLDEILLGTNTRERQIASRQVLSLLLDTGAIGAVTTHDLSLAALQSERDGAVVNVHFRDLLVDQQMTFDYQLREGVVDTSNALQVLRQVGIPVEDR